MDEAERDLVNQLATRASMLLEDATGPLILLPGELDGEMRSTLIAVLKEIGRARELIKAAHSITE